jgi:hypothetical protein
MMNTGQNAPAKIAVRPSMEKAADTQASASATMKAASLTDVAERRIALGPETPVTSTDSVTAGVSSVTTGVTDVVTMIASALRRIRPATSHVFNRRLVRILFQPHWRPSSAALAVTRPSGWERSQVSASLSSNGWGGTDPIMMSCRFHMWPARPRGAPPGCPLRTTTASSRKGGVPGAR